MADWYEQTFGSVGDGEEAAFLVEAIGDGGGRVCLDVGCGTGRYSALVGSTRHVPIGFDLSFDQLRLARSRLPVVRADVERLPVRDASVDVAVVLYVATDVEDFGAVLAEVARCVRPGGRVVVVGVHPCFVGPFVDRTGEARDGALTFVPGYGRGGWVRRGSGDAEGLWARVGGHHVTLAEFLGAFISAGLTVGAVREFSGGGSVLPRNLGVVAVAS